jgi:predicted Zn-dependent protease
MARELKARKIDHGPYFFADHPRLEERIQNFSEFARDAPAPADNGRERFLEATRQARLDALDMIWKRDDGVTLVFLLDTEQRLATLPPWCRFYLGEGYRLRNEDGDAERAIAELERTTREAPEFAASWNALGRLYLRQGAKDKALQAFQRYVAMDPQGREAGYARQYIAQLQQELAP